MKRRKHTTAANTGRATETWPRYRQAVRSSGADWRTTVPPQTLRLTALQNFLRSDPLLCPQHPDQPALTRGAICPFCGWPEIPHSRR